MLDLTLFKVGLPSKENNIQSTALILSGCRTIVTDETSYSEQDEQNYCLLNDVNDFGKLDIELSFENTMKNPYLKFYIRCVTIRTNNEKICAIDKSMPEQFKFDNYTKVTKDGKMAVGITYFFRSAEEREKLLNCNSFCVEGFISLKNKTTVYGFVCRVVHQADGWELVDGNTFRTSLHTNIESYIH